MVVRFLNQKQIYRLPGCMWKNVGILLDQTRLLPISG